MKSLSYSSKTALVSFLGLCFLCLFFYLMFFPQEEPEVVSLKQNTGGMSLPSQQVTPRQLSDPVAFLRPLIDPYFLLKPEMRGGTVLTRTESGWSRDEASCKGDKSAVKIEFNSPAGLTRLYVHPEKTDKGISGTLIKGKMWESKLVNKTYNLLKSQPDLEFLDLGANVGVYGITAAKLGRKVILVDPLLTNTRKLCKSVQDGYFNDVYVIRNALSSERHRVSFTNQFAANVGATHIRDATPKDNDTAYAVLLDDVLDVFNFTKVAIKMEVEGHEHRLLKGAEKFFSKVDVRYIQMEWREDKWSVKTGQSIIDFLARFKMAPFHPFTDKPLSPQRLLKFYGDVFWKKL